MKATMKVYITRYALTTGIIEKEVQTNPSISEKMVTEVGGRGIQSYHKPFWHETKEEAIAHANIMRERKISSHKKAITKLNNLTF